MKLVPQGVSNPDEFIHHYDCVHKARGVGRYANEYVERRVGELRKPTRDLDAEMRKYQDSYLSKINGHLKGSIVSMLRDRKKSALVLPLTRDKSSKLVWSWSITLREPNAYLNAAKSLGRLNAQERKQKKETQRRAKIRAKIAKFRKKQDDDKTLNHHPFYT